MFLEIKEFIRNKFYLFVLITGSILLFISVLVYFNSTNGRILHGVTVLKVKVGGLTLKEAKVKLSKELNHLAEKRVILNYNHRNVPIVLSAIGIHLDFPATVKQAYLFGRSGSLGSKIITRLKLYRRDREVEPIVEYNQETLAAFYRLLDASIAIEPVRSLISINRNGKVSYTPSRVGRTIDYQNLTKLLGKALCDPAIDQIEIPIQTIIPPLNETDIKNWGLDQVLGIFTTKFNPTQTDRVLNIQIACNAINNSLIYPGQNFSFNTWVGPRASEAGYKEAPTIFMGKLVPGIGGGICQVSSTLYNAVLLANLVVVQRYNHSIPSNYVPLGRDATVVYGGIDLIFENNNPKPLLLVANVESPYVTVAILGEKQAWDKVILETNVVETYPFKTVVTADPTLKQDERVKVQNGQSGSKIELWRTVEFQDGHTEKSFESTSIYPALPEEYKIGTKQNKK